MKVNFFIYGLLFFVLIANSSSSQITFQMIFGTANDGEFGESVKQTSDDGYIIGGYLSPPGNDDAYLIKTDQYGNITWAKTIGDWDYEWMYSIQIISDGYILGGTWNGALSTYRDAYLIKADHNGDKVWMKPYGGSNNEWGYSVIQTSDQGFALCGATSSFGSGKQAYLVKTDSLGNQMWQKSYGGANTDEVYCIRQTFDNGFIMCGKTESFSAAGNYIYAIKTDQNGDTIWTNAYGSAGTEIGRSVIQTADSGFVFCGYKLGSGNSQIFLVKTNNDGDSIWGKYIGSPDNDYVYSIQQTNDNGFIICGESSVSGHGYDIYLVKTDQNGNMQWSKTYGSTYDEYGKEVIQTNDGGYIIVGHVYNSDNSDFNLYLIKTDANGFASGVGMKEMEFSSNNLISFPNPCSDIININYNPGDNRIEVFNSQGKLVYTETFYILDSQPIKRIDLSHLPSSLYIIRITNENIVSVERVLKN